jgi:hypothetical protein
MIATALDDFTAPPSSKLLGWHLLDARPQDDWIVVLGDCGVPGVHHRHCEERKRRSNPFFPFCGAMDCFASLAMT